MVFTYSIINKAGSVYLPENKEHRVSFLDKVREVNSVIWGLPNQQKRDLIGVGLTLFLIFFSYPLMRSTTTSLLLTALGVKASPYAWIYSVVALSFSVSILNSFQKKLRPQALFSLVVLITVILFVGLYFGYKAFGDLWTYPLYVLKEVYIVLLVHSVLGYINSSVEESVAKVVYGPLGAIGSLGGILGGLVTTALVKDVGVFALYFCGVFLIFSTLIFFRGTSDNNVHLVEAKERSPLQSIAGIKSFVFLVATIVLLSQFVINIGNYQFNVFLGEAFKDSVSKTEFLGKIYASINSFSLVAQVIFLPFLLRYVPHFFTHLSIPIIYGGAFFMPLFFGGDGLMPMAMTFVVFKGLDYSVFGAAKELLYYALTDIQKYGAKYVADMITYRLAKGIISLILIKIPSNLINSLLGVCLVAWIFCLFPLFKQYKKYHDQLEDPDEPTPL